MGRYVMPTSRVDVRSGEMQSVKYPKPHKITKVNTWCDGKMTVVINGKHVHAGSEAYLRKVLKDRYGLNPVKIVAEVHS